MSSDIAISVNNLTKSYQIYDKPRDRLLQMLSRGRKQYFREFQALQGVSFDVNRGDTVGIIGRNGSGKSTLLQLLCGTLTPTNGNITVNGRVAALLELGAGFNPEFSGKENVFLSASLYGLTSSQITERFDKILDFADIGEFIDHPVKTYSSGMFVRLAFAVIAHVDADILIIDEALAVGDAYFVQKCMRFLRAFTKHGTLFFVSHDTAAVVGLCSKALLLNGGRLERIGTPKDISEYYLASLHNDMQGMLPATKSSDLDTSSNNDFGVGEGKIVSVTLINDDGQPILNVHGEESVILVVDCFSELGIDQVIVGFLVRDRLGQVVFGENTCSQYSDRGLTLHSRQPLRVGFEFVMPLLQSGDYSVTVAIAQGTQADHLQHHWIHDALIIHAQSERVYSGVICIPMKTITSTILPT
jgi:lipopolysaccharide transport system ATP-binding protein